MVFNFVVEIFSSKPNFAIMPILWWEGFAIDDSNLIYEVFVKTKKRERLSKFLESQVLGPLWADGSILHNDSGLAIQFVSPVKLRMDISHAFKEMLLKHIADFEKLGIDFKEEITGDMLTTMDSDGASSALTASWTTVPVSHSGRSNPLSSRCYVARIFFLWNFWTGL